MFIPNNCMFIPYNTWKMNLLAEILSSKVRAEIFRILFGINIEELHLREIQRRTGFAIGTVRQEVLKLVTNGLIVKRVSGNRTYFRANKNHPLFTEIHNLVLKTSGLVDIFKIALNNKLIRFAFVFGSIASGNIKEDSDVDIFIIGDIGLREVSKLLKGQSNLIGREINVHVMEEQEFISRKQQKEHFIARILESTILMIIGNEIEFNKLGK